MKTILDQILEQKHQEINHLKQHVSFSEFTRQPEFGRPVHSLKAQLLHQSFGIIAEIKRKSPSGGDIRPNLNPEQLASYYQQNGACGISVLTDYNYFGGTTKDLELVRRSTTLPILRKEFILDELQLFESKAIGADAVLLIASVLEKQQAHHLTIVAKSIGLEVVFEVHSARDLEKINDEVGIIAVNNRDLSAQQTSLEHSFRLSAFLPAFAPSISASGIQTSDELTLLQDAGFRGALIGEGILRNNHLNSLTFQKAVV